MELKHLTYPYPPMPPEKRRELLPERNICSLAPAADPADALFSGNGSHRIDVTGQPYRDGLTANMELLLDSNVARAGVSPALNLENSYTKNADLLISDKQKEGLTLIRTMLGNTSSAVAIPQLLSMMEKTANNEMLLLKMKDWFALMNR